MRSFVEQAPRVLLLTSGLGTGHSRAMTAIESALLAQAPLSSTCTVDFWSLINVEVGHAIRQTYLKLVTEHPDLYHRLYQLDQHSWRNILELGAPLPELIHELRDFIVYPAEPSLTKTERHWFDRLLFRQLLAILEKSSAGGMAELPFRGLWQRSAVHRSWALMTRRLHRLVERFAPDVVVATQVNMAALAARLKKQDQLQVPLVGVITDYGIHDFWLQPQIDAYCLPDESLRPCLPNASACEIEVTGMPLTAGFDRPPRPAQAREELGLPAHRRIVLLLGGGLGLGIDSTVRVLLDSLPPDDPPLLVVMAGRNAQLLRSLEGCAATRAALQADAIRVQGWSDRMADCIRAADVVVGKPGGLTTAEVLACGRPLLSTCSLGGQEAFNVAYLESNSVGELVDERQLATRVFALLDNQLALQRLQTRAWETGKRNGAERVANLVLRHAARRPWTGTGAAARQRAR